LYEVFHQKLLQQKLQPGTQAHYQGGSQIRHVPHQVLIFGFSPSGIGKPKSRIASPLPLSNGIITNHQLAFTGLLMDPPSLPPLPSLPSRCRNKTDEHHSSNKVTYSSQTMTDHQSVTISTNHKNPFEGKPSFTDPSLPNWNHSPINDHHQSNEKNLSSSHNKNHPLDSFNHQGTDFYYLLGIPIHCLSLIGCH
jgi:hypothetical protein